MATLQTGEIPDGVDMTALQSLMTEIQALDTKEFQEAGDNINKHAKDECGVDLAGLMPDGRDSSTAERGLGPGHVVAAFVNHRCRHSVTPTP